jgi:CHAD domain-containing protein
VPTIGADAAAFAARVKDLQSILGEHHDSVVSRELLLTLAVGAHRAGENAFTYGRLHALEEAVAAEEERQYVRAWRAASRKKLRSWLR